MMSPSATRILVLAIVVVAHMIPTIFSAGTCYSIGGRCRTRCYTEEQSADGICGMKGRMCCVAKKEQFKVKKLGSYSSGGQELASCSEVSGSCRKMCYDDELRYITSDCKKNDGMCCVPMVESCVNMTGFCQKSCTSDYNTLQTMDCKVDKEVCCTPMTCVEKRGTCRPAPCLADEITSMTRDCTPDGEVCCVDQMMIPCSQRGGRLESYCDVGEQVFVTADCAEVNKYKGKEPQVCCVPLLCTQLGGTCAEAVCAPGTGQIAIKTNDCTTNPLFTKGVCCVTPAACAASGTGGMCEFRCDDMEAVYPATDCGDEPGEGPRCCAVPPPPA